MANYILVLGAPNDNQGNLSIIAATRLLKAIDVYIKYGYKIICTGGFGDGFNTTSVPHAEYAKRFLTFNGVPDSDILGPVLSSNTVEDAVKTSEYIENLNVNCIYVVSSDFHMPRVKFIFNKTLGLICELLFVVSDSSQLNLEKRNELLLHEKKSLDSLIKNGLIVNGKVIQ